MRIEEYEEGCKRRVETDSVTLHQGVMHRIELLFQAKVLQIVLLSLPIREQAEEFARLGLDVIFQCHTDTWKKVPSVFEIFILQLPGAFKKTAKGFKDRDAIPILAFIFRQIFDCHHSHPQCDFSAPGLKRSSCKRPDFRECWRFSFSTESEKDPPDPAPRPPGSGYR